MNIEHAVREYFDIEPRTSGGQRVSPGAMW